ncbi:MAG TPA: DUF3566 domain-containing protein [Marmoricola sp.]
MADRRAEEAPVAPRRTLSSSRAAESTGDEEGKSVPAAVQKAMGKVKAAAASARTTSQARRSERPERERPVRERPVTPSGSSRRSIRKARLRLVQVDAWSVMKTAFLLSIAIGIITVVAVAVIWSVLGAAGVWDSINAMVQQTVGSDSTTPFHIQDYVGTSRVLGFTMIVAVVDVILITALSTLGAFVYNLAATLVGGVEVTLAEDL